MEEFKDIEGYEGLYKISNLGNVKNKHGRILKPGISRGYLNVGMCKNKIQKTLYVHRLVAETFINNPENKEYIDHINGMKTDNRIENLRWATHSENMMNINVQSNNKLQIKGIRKCQESFQAYITKNRKCTSKNFKELEEAISWRKAKELELFGEYNFKTQSQLLIQDNNF